MFVDRVQLQLVAGSGGNGVVAWRREKYIPKGGPTGGNGGRGANLYLQACREVFSLQAFRYKRIIKADSGANGASNSRQGKSGKDLILQVPCGTLVKDKETGTIYADLSEDGEMWLACEGGKGGKGNEFFKSPTRQAPNFATLGTPGEEKKVELELKLIADIGLIGFPNAGKSTLISQLAHLKVKTAPYPFTTLQPNIGFFTCKDLSRLYIADIPGIIEGAHANRGLGLAFLRHIERTHLLLFILDASGIDGRNPLDDFEVLKNEIEAHNPDILKKPFFILLNKMDTDEAKELAADFKEKIDQPGVPLFSISALSGEGLVELESALKNAFGKS